jgi:hypothetical protein
MDFITKSVEDILNDCNNLKITDQNDEQTQEDDYEYDVPENNKPLGLTNSLLKQQQQQPVKTSYSNNELTKPSSNSPNTSLTSPSIQKARKSNSPTIDSGISSSSLMSLNDLLPNLNNISTELAQPPPPPLPTSKIPSNEINQIETRLNKIIKTIRETCKILFQIQEYSGWRERNNLEKKLLQIKISFFEIKNLLNEFNELILILKNGYLQKNNNNKSSYNELCMKLNDFIQKFNSNINILNTLKWDINILASNNRNRNNLNDELDENLLRLNYLIELIQVINDFNYQYNIFNSKKYELPKLKHDSNDYSDVDNDDDDDIYENDDDEWLKPSEIKVPKEEQQHSSNFSDQMLIKFYSKHIDDNFNDIKSFHAIIKKKLSSCNDDDDELVMDLTNKLALSGHKLVFICDTLNRNLINFSLKSSLNCLSNNLCDCLKLYVIRIKTFYSNNDSKSNLLIIDSLGQVFNCALQLKQLIIKYL